MQSLSDDERKQVLGEVLADELKVIRQYVQELPKIKHIVTKLKEDMKELKSDIKIIKAAVTDLSRHQKDHEHRIARLEAA